MTKLLNVAAVLTKDKFLEKLQEREKVTPDINSLKFFKTVPLFVYGLEKADGALWKDTIAGSLSLGRALTMDDKFVMQQTVHQPVVFKTHESDFKKARIKGEVYLVPPERIIQHDNINHNGRLFRRVSQRFMLFEKSRSHEGLKKWKDMYYIQGFMYIGLYPSWKGSKLSELPKIRLPSIPSIRLYPFYEWTNPWEDDGDYNILWGNHVSIH